MNDDALLYVGDARLPADLRQAVEQIIEETQQAKDNRVGPLDILDALTAIRRQTAVDEKTGAPDEHTLRAMRVVLRGTPFEAQLTFTNSIYTDPQQREDDLALLTACIMALRRAGTGRNRGRGRLRASLHEHDIQTGRPGKEITKNCFDCFSKEICS